MGGSAQAVALVFWSRGGSAANGPELQKADPALLALGHGGRFRRAVLQVPADGMLRLSLTSPRPLRAWVGNTLVLDEALSWRLFNRRVYAAAILPVKRGECEVIFEFGERPRHPATVDEHCASRNRDCVMAELTKRIPETLELSAELVPGMGPAVGLRSTPTQVHRDGVAYQEILVRPVGARTSFQR